MNNDNTLPVFCGHLEQAFLSREGLLLPLVAAAD